MRVINPVSASRVGSGNDVHDGAPGAGRAGVLREQLQLWAWRTTWRARHGDLPHGDRQSLSLRLAGPHRSLRSMPAPPKEGRAAHRARRPTPQDSRRRASARTSPRPASTAATPGTGLAAPPQGYSARKPHRHASEPHGREPSDQTRRASDRPRPHPPPRRRSPAVCGSSGDELYNLVRPHSAHGGLTPDAVRLDPAAGRLRHPNRSAGRPLPSATETRYQTQGLSQ